MYEKYFTDIVKTINAQVQKKWPPLTTGENGIFAWAIKNQQELYAQVTALDAEINTLWNNPPPTPYQEGNKDFEKFKAQVLAWGRVILQIYKKFAEVKP